MPKKRLWEETVAPYPPLTERRNYTATVASVTKDATIRIGLRLADPEQDGRVVETLLPTPLRPGNLAGRFFQAAGLAVTAGEKIRPPDAVGKTVRVRFAVDPKTNDAVAVDFEPEARKEVEHGPH